MGKKEINVLYIDDERNNLTAFTAAFRTQFNVFTASTTSNGRDILNSEDIHVLITDQYLGGASGIAFLNGIQRTHPDVSRMLLTGQAVMEDLIEAVNKTHIFAYIGKPWDEQMLVSLINAAYEKCMDKREKDSLIINLQRTNEQLEFMLREKLVS